MDQGIMTLITVGIVLALAAFVLWLLYTVIWRAVRRGMLEFADSRIAQVRQARSMEPAEAVAPVAPVKPMPVMRPMPAVGHHHRLVPLHLPRRVAAEVVPDYPPSDWF
ncbi:MAG TPA: hypothetical protein VFQ74_06300 [Pseudolysinimonas sp.]|nr:hypothetical protein [Pseudolysinimonas sp.]